MAYPHFYSLFNCHLYSICQLYTVYPQSVRVVFRKTYSEPDAGYHFFVGSYDGRSSWHCSHGLFVDLYITTFFCIRCMRLFQTHLGLSWTRYDVISVSAARLLVAAVGCSCCKVHGNSRGEFVGDRPPQLIPATHLLRIYGCQQNVSATVVVGKSSHVSFGIEVFITWV